MIDEKDINIDGIDFVIGKFPATAGREIIFQYPTSGLPKIGDYKTNEEIMLKIVKHADVRVQDKRINLENKTLVDNHVRSWETLAKLEWEIMNYNCSFLANGKALDFFKMLSDLAVRKVTEMLTGSLAQSSPTEKQP